MLVRAVIALVLALILAVIVAAEPLGYSLGSGYDTAALTITAALLGLAGAELLNEVRQRGRNRDAEFVEEERRQRVLREDEAGRLADERTEHRVQEETLKQQERRLARIEGELREELAGRSNLARDLGALEQRIAQQKEVQREQSIEQGSHGETLGELQQEFARLEERQSRFMEAMRSQLDSLADAFAEFKRGGGDSAARGRR